MIDKIDHLRIVFSGSAGIGKSTLINALKKKYDFFNVQKEPIRGILKDKTKVDFADDDIQLRILNNQRNYLLENSFVMADRSCLDSFSYCEGLRAEGKTNISEDVYKFIEAESKLIMQSCFVDMIVFPPIEFDLVDDGFRNIDPISQRKMQDVMETNIYEWGINHKVIRPSGSVEERVNFVSMYIDAFLEGRNLLNENNSLV